MAGTAQVKKRTGIHSVVHHREAVSTDTKAAENFVTEFKRFVDSEGYLPQQIFNWDAAFLEKDAEKDLHNSFSPQACYLSVLI